MAARLRQSARFARISASNASFSVVDGSYVLALASLPAHYAALYSAPSNAINIFDKITLQQVLLLPGHTQPNTSLKAVSNFGPQPTNAILTSGRDGCIKLWDGTSTTPSFQSSFNFPLIVIRVDTPI
jgi:WD repeat-containing protein 89